MGLVYEFFWKECSPFARARSKAYGKWRVPGLLCINIWGKCADGIWPLGSSQSSGQRLLSYDRDKE